VRTNVVKLRPRVEKVCKDCAAVLVSDNWYASCRKQCQYYCKRCWNEKFYFAVKTYKYGIDREEFERFLRNIDGRCTICREVMRENGVCVDHDHKTQWVRGLLCRSCNSGLGLFCDDPGRLRAAADYLEAAEELRVLTKARDEWYQSIAKKGRKRR
jgi:hypothetical protein